MAWRLYESVRKDAVDADSVQQFMSTFDQREGFVTGSWVERDIYSQDSELTRQWALAIVEDAVNRKIENY